MDDHATMTPSQAVVTNARHSSRIVLTSRHRQQIPTDWVCIEPTESLRSND
jgi:hypothetical protein